MKRMTLGAAIALSMVGMAGASLAEDMAAVVQARHAHYKEIGAAMKGLSEQMKSPAPNLAQVQTYARRLDDLAPQIPGWFPAGSGPASGLKTQAKAAIWERPDEFKADAASFAQNAHKLQLAAARGDLAGVGAALPAVGQSCGTCHKAFREKED
jgi:cytochrome c556